MELLTIGFLMVIYSFLKSWNKSVVILVYSSFLVFWSIKLMKFSSGGYVLLCSWFMVDSISSLMVLLTVVVMLISFLCSDKDFNFSEDVSGFSVSLVLVSFICVLFFMTSSIFLFYFFFEASLIPTLFLILGWGYQPERLQAGFYMMLYTVSASMPLFFMVYSVWSLNLSESMGEMMFLLVSFGSQLSWVMIILAFLVKLPVFLVHSWLPKAHVEAPVSGSMVLAGVLLKMGGYGIYRWFVVMKFFSGVMSELVLISSLWGGFLCSVMCMCQSDMKALIAYSSIGHMSLVLGGVMSLFCLGWMGGICLMFAHGLCSPCMFSLANYTYGYFSSRSMAVCKGVLKVFPGLTFLWFLISVLNLGCPPSLNFLSECFLVGSVVFISWFYLFPLGLLCFITAGYCLFLYCSVNHGGYVFSGKSLAFNSERCLVSVGVCSFILFASFIALDFVFL